MATTTALFSSPSLKLLPRAIKSRNSLYTPAIFTNSRSAPSSSSSRLLRLRRRAAVEEVAVGDAEGAAASKEGSVAAAAAAAAVEEEEEEEEEKRRKLYVVNLPWNFSAPDIQKLFGECGTVKDVEIIKQKNGKSRGFAFVTMASGDEARAVIDRFDSYELTGRIIRVEFAKSFRKPAPPPPPGASLVEERHKIYVSNLAWKARSVHLKEFFSAKYKPLSARVVFENATGRSAGYGFVAFATKEEAAAAIAELDGKELLDRPVRLRFRQKDDDKTESAPEEEKSAEEQHDES
ncbi:RNA-binding protein CP33, chloroplastic [Ananas comosus]|uniref:RNA-binding protein CP33, chloroplastic n=1 Tax=Ananas comosus TaxID=4615 RepID=A0A199UDE1_ANACO|nr:RNA-binding protein CP33, chloroplastic [Ananas comosus]